MKKTYGIIAMLLLSNRQLPRWNWITLNAMRTTGFGTASRSAWMPLS
jgi:hypothetical protein